MAWSGRRRRLFCRRGSIGSHAGDAGGAAKLLISPLAGEMAGRPEGGVKERYLGHAVTLPQRVAGWTGRRDSTPSALPGISPARGEIRRHSGFR
ncbi:MAG: hypothetical protein EOR60_25540 [Mesorhizobium sp.]|nr:MAG: hypothetical protein EOR60_25540 [Mesorhizobium sp.]